MSETNSKEYWDERFLENWEHHGGRLQTVLFAVGFIFTKDFKDIGSVVDYGCGLGDSMPVLGMKYPNTWLYFYDLSDIAMKKAQRSFGNIAQPFNTDGSQKVDLVYCSNAIEHIENPVEFARKLISFSNKYVVIQAPYNERDTETGEPLSPKNGEHINTLLEDTFDELSDLVDWEIIITKIPYAWPYGDQIFYVGTKK